MSNRCDAYGPIRCGAYGSMWFLFVQEISVGCQTDAMHMVRCDVVHMDRCGSCLFKTDHSDYTPMRCIWSDAMWCIWIDAVLVCTKKFNRSFPLLSSPSLIYLFHTIFFRGSKVRLFCSPRCNRCDAVHMARCCSCLYKKVQLMRHGAYGPMRCDAYGPM